MWLPSPWDAPDGFTGAGVTLGRRELALQGSERLDDLWGLECPVPTTNGDLAEDGCPGKTLDRLIGVDETPTDQRRCVLTVTTGAPTSTRRRRSADDRARARPSRSRHSASMASACCSNDAASSTDRLQAVAKRPTQRLIPSRACSDVAGATAAHVIERYAARWSIEVAIEDAKQLGGVGQARNRLERAVQRTIPFGLVVNTLVICWYAKAGHHPGDVEAARALAPRYRQKVQPSVLDMFAKLRHVINAAQSRRVDPAPLTSQESPSCAWPGRAWRRR